MMQIFSHAGREVSQSTMNSLLKTEEQDGYIPSKDPIMGFFLDGLIIHKWGNRTVRLFLQKSLLQS
jgi:uncharacterized protein YehS (DUF1456 family)